MSTDTVPAVDKRDTRRMLNRHYAGGWELADLPVPGLVAAFVQRPSGRSIVVSVMPGDDGHDWVHASTAHPSQMPTYDDLKVLHRAVFGDRYAYQAFVPASEHVNFHEFALHLWGRYDGADVLGLAP